MMPPSSNLQHLTDNTEHLTGNIQHLAPQLQTLLSQFEAGTIPLSSFHHREHLIVALCYASLYPPEESLARIRIGLQRVLAANGKPPSAYRETLTALWMQRANAFLLSRVGTTLAPVTISAWLQHAVSFPADEP